MMTWLVDELQLEHFCDHGMMHWQLHSDVLAHAQFQACCAVVLTETRYLSARVSKNTLCPAVLGDTGMHPQGKESLVFVCRMVQA